MTIRIQGSAAPESVVVLAPASAGGKSWAGANSPRDRRAMAWFAICLPLMTVRVALAMAPLFFATHHQHRYGPHESDPRTGWAHRAACQPHPRHSTPTGPCVPTAPQWSGMTAPPVRRYIRPCGSLSPCRSDRGVPGRWGSRNDWGSVRTSFAAGTGLLDQHQGTLGLGCLA